MTSPGVVACVAAAAFVFQLEATVVAVALPSIARELGLTTTGASFVVSSYLLAATVVFLPFGKLGDRKGLRKAFLLAVALLSGGTFLSAASPGAAGLVASRVLSGAGAGGMSALAYAMIPAFVPREEAGAAYGTVSLFAGLGMLAGSPLGGLLAQVLPWRGIFLVNAVAMAGLFAFAWRAVPAREPDPSAVASRSAGASSLLLGGTAAAAVVSLSMGEEWGWVSPETGIAVAVAILLATAFAVVERRAPVPVLSPALLGTPGLASGLAILFLGRVAGGGVSFLMPFYLEVEAGLRPAAVGSVLLAYAGVYALAGWRAGRLADRIGARLLVPVGLAWGAAACAVFALFAVSPAVRSLAAPIAFLAALGLGTGVSFPANNKRAMAGVPAGSAGEASALLALALNLGTAVGVSLLETVATLGTGSQGAALEPGFRAAFGSAAALLAGAALLAVRDGRPEPLPEEGT